MKKLLFLVLVVLIGVIAFMTRPDKQAHKEAMMKAVKEYVDEEATNKGLGNNGLTRLGKNIVNKAVEAALNNKLKLDDYYLFNTTHVKMGDKQKTLSVGLFGKVITFDKDMLREALNESSATDFKDELKSTLKEQKREAKRMEKEQRKEQKRLEKEQKRLEKEAKKAEKERLKREKESQE